MTFILLELPNHKPTVLLYGRAQHLLISHIFTVLPPTLLSPSLAYLVIPFIFLFHSIPHHLLSLYN